MELESAIQGTPEHVDGGKKEIELEIAHVLFIDTVGYSKLLIDDQRGLIDTLNQIVRGTAEFRIAEAAGKLIKIATGDGMALAFYNRLEAPVECALQISRALKQHPELRVRMGVHSGPVSAVIDVNERTNVAGAGINMARRVMECGDAGHILLSQHIADDLQHFVRWRPHLHDLGDCEVKHGARLHLFNLYTEDLGNPELPEKFSESTKRTGTLRWPLIGAAALIIAVLALAFLISQPKQLSTTSGSTSDSTASVAAFPEKSIAVLPFENRSEDKANAYFADGIQDEILTRLSKIADLKVISRTSTQHYKSTPENLREIAKQLGVAHIIEGSVQKSGDAVRVNVQLIKAANDSHLWADTFDRKLTDIFSVESDIAKAIADQLQAKLTGREEQVIAAKPTNNPEAYDAYLRGLAYTLKTLPTPVNALGAQKYLREAVRLDPKFALAWALLSIVDSRNYVTQSLQPTAALREEARQAAETALTLQPNLGEAVLAKGTYHYSCLKDYDTAVRYFERAHQLLPNSSSIPEWLAYVSRRRGQWDRSEAYFIEAERLDPRNVSLLFQHATNDICHRHFRKARQKFDEALNITPDDLNILVQQASIAQAEGDLPRASALLAQLHFTANDLEGLETQVYQAILERRPTTVIAYLKEILAKPDPALGYFNGVLRFWLGWAQEVAGDNVDAQATWRQTRRELEAFLKEQPYNFLLISDLALTNMGLGDKTAALALSERAMAANPVEKDAVAGPIPIEVLARVAARMGEPDRAIAALQQLLSIPYNGALAAGTPLTPAMLRLDPMFDPLRSDPRFQELVASPAPQ
jgi:TolB-like protein/class 3 adenylate cyclase/Tfp pilus assembly protein PilF